VAMKKILFLPFLQMRSGHHQVAEALMDMVLTEVDGIFVKKVDLLSYTSPLIEKVITNSYLKWIKYAPETYNFTYKKYFCSASSQNQSVKWFYFLLKKMGQLVREEKPDLIVCTHSFPSYLLSKLKDTGECDVPVVNAYTDFFINSVWGIDEIDYHLLPNTDLKEEISEMYHVSDKRMIVTGIPVHQEISPNERAKKPRDRPKILIAGGNNGLGSIVKLLSKSIQSSHSDFFVLCGNNRKLYKEICSWNIDHIKPLPYISSRSEMNKLYEEMDAMVTKPGGVTISEALRKRLPIFVQSVLPGQEEINLRYLTDKGLVFQLGQEKLFEQELLDTLNDSKRMNQWEQSINSYLTGLEIDEPKEIAELFTEIMDNKFQLPTRYGEQSKVYRVAKA